MFLSGLSVVVAAILAALASALLSLLVRLLRPLLFPRRLGSSLVKATTPTSPSSIPKLSQYVRPVHRRQHSHLLSQSHLLSLPSVSSADAGRSCMDNYDSSHDPNPHEPSSKNICHSAVIRSGIPFRVQGTTVLLLELLSTTTTADALQQIYSTHLNGPLLSLSPPLLLLPSLSPPPPPPLSLSPPPPPPPSSPPPPPPKLSHTPRSIHSTHSVRSIAMPETLVTSETPLSIIERTKEDACNITRKAKSVMVNEPHVSSNRSTELPRNGVNRHDATVLLHSHSSHLPHSHQGSSSAHLDRFTPRSSSTEKTAYTSRSACQNVQKPHRSTSSASRSCLSNPRRPLPPSLESTPLSLSAELSTKALESWRSSVHAPTTTNTMTNSTSRIRVSPQSATNRGSTPRSTHVSDYRSTHASDYRSTHASDYRSTHVSDYRSTHVSDYRSTHASDYRSIHTHASVAKAESQPSVLLPALNSEVTAPRISAWNTPLHPTHVNELLSTGPHTCHHNTNALQDTSNSKGTTPLRKSSTPRRAISHPAGLQSTAVNIGRLHSPLLSHTCKRQPENGYSHEVSNSQSNGRLRRSASSAVIVPNGQSGMNPIHDSLAVNCPSQEVLSASDLQSDPPMTAWSRRHTKSTTLPCSATPALLTPHHQRSRSELMLSHNNEVSEDRHVFPRSAYTSLFEKLIQPPSADLLQLPFFASSSSADTLQGKWPNQRNGSLPQAYPTQNHPEKGPLCKIQAGRAPLSHQDSSLNQPKDDSQHYYSVFSGLTVHLDNDMHAPIACFDTKTRPSNNTTANHLDKRHPSSTAGYGPIGAFLQHDDKSDGVDLLLNAPSLFDQSPR
ncbi:hypothetical protein BASA60_001420 [Batrachochytrium salamandrivorans]|nr:hypothetical protein BASA60_001420 [Batrachochytrium salamandrivorans]